MSAPILTDEEILAMLSDPLQRQWRAHGIGFMKTYLDDTKTWQLNVWHGALQIPGVSVTHDHPWPLRSTIRAGQITNTRLLPCRKESVGAILLQKGLINGSNFCGIQGPPEDVILCRCPPEIYHPGDYYVQRPEEIHESQAVDGTVTIVQRGETSAEGAAHVFWPAGQEWMIDSRRPPNEDELRVVCRDAMARFGRS